jgi:hypothetical protein
MSGRVLRLCGCAGCKRSNPGRPGKRISYEEYEEHRLFERTLRQQTQGIIPSFDAAASIPASTAPSPASAPSISSTAPTPAPNVPVSVVDYETKIKDKDDINVAPPKPRIDQDRLDLIQSVLGIREKHKTTKAVITAIFQLLHEKFTEHDDVKQLPKTWQQANAMLDELKPKFIKVTHASLRTHIELTLMSLRAHCELTASSLRAHCELTSSSLPAHFQLTSNSIRTHFTLTLNPLRGHFEPTSHPFRSHFELIPNLLRFRINTIDPFRAYIQIDVCVKECMLYRGRNKDSIKCEVCGEVRYGEHTASEQLAAYVQQRTDPAYRPNNKKKKKLTPRAVYRYCPLIPRLIALISHPVLSHIFFYGDAHRVRADPNVIDDIHQTDAYAAFCAYFPTKEEDPVNGVCDLRVALGVGADSASMSKHKMRNDYSALPLLASICNWPIWFRCQEKHLLLLGMPPFKTHNPSIYFGTHTHTHTHTVTNQRAFHTCRTIHR